MRLDPILLVNRAADAWLAAFAAATLEAAALFAVVGLLWLAIRRRAAPQVGAWLFLLVPLKLLMPASIVLPAALARRTPSGMATAWLRPPPIQLVEGRAADPELTARVVAPLPTPAGAVEARRVAAPPAPARPQRAAAAPLPEPAAVSTPTPAAVALAAWLAGVATLGGRLLANERRARARLRGAEPAPSVPGVDLEEVRRAAGVGCRVRFAWGDAGDAPAVWGVIRPTVVLPRGIEGTLDAAQLRWVLLHELAHVRRGDLLAVGLQRLAAVVHFFNPVVWLANRLVDHLRELACDDFALAVGQTPPEAAGGAFVAVLRRVAPRRAGLRALGIFGIDARASTIRRVERLLDDSRPLRPRLGLPTRLALVALALVALPHVRAAVEPPPAAPQPPTRPAPAAAPAEVPPLVAGGDFELTVAGPAGKPVAGAQVEFRADPQVEDDQVRRGRAGRRGPYGLDVEADEAGRIVVNFPRVPTRLQLFITIPDYGAYMAGWSSREHLEVIPTRFMAELDAGWAVGGVVVDPEGKPVRGATIHPFFESKKRPGDRRQLGAGGQIRTDEGGRWHYDSVPATLPEVAVEIAHPDFVPVQIDLGRAGFEVKPGAEAAAPIRLARGLTVAGTVTDEAGRPIEGATVRAKLLNDIRRARTAADGTYRLVGLPALGMINVAVGAPGRAIDARQVDVHAGIGPVDFALQPGRTIRILVRDGSGRPIPRARIYFQRWRNDFAYFAFGDVNQYADARGEWTWAEAPADAFTADICPTGDDLRQAEAQPLVARAEPYEFRLRPALTVAGTVVDAATRAPIPRFRVVPGWDRPGQGPFWSTQEAFDGRDGRFRFRADRGDGTLLRVEADGYRALESRRIGADEGAVAIDLALEAAPGVAVKVVGPDLQPVAGARVVLATAGSQVYLRDGTFDPSMTFADWRDADAAGVARFSAQAKGFHLLITHPAGFAEVAGEPDWAATRIVRLEPWARVVGTFRVDGRPAGNAPLRLETARRLGGDSGARAIVQTETSTGPDGRFAFDRVIPGPGSLGRRILLMVDTGSAEKTSSTMVPGDFPAGRTTEVDLGVSGRAVVGRLRPRAGFAGDPPWNFGLVTARPAAGRDPDAAGFQVSLTATVDRDGTFRIDDAPPGDYLLDVSFTGAGFAAGSIRQLPLAVPSSGAGPLDLGTLPLR